MAENDARLQVVLEAKIDKLIERLNAANRAVYGSAGKFQKSVDQINRKFQTLGSGLGVAAERIRGYLAAIGVALSVREVQQYADAWTNARNKLAAAGVATGQLAARQNELADLANRTRSGFNETVDLYAKLTRATEELGASEAQIARATEIVNKSFKAGGAAASEQAAGILQLSQALGSGVLQGDELRSLRENAPLLAKAIAKEFDTTIAGLKKLGSEGKLTSDRVFKAILNSGKEIDAQFAKTIPTIADSFTKLQTEFGRYINGANAATGASAQLAGFISQVADNFEQLADAAIVAASVIGGALAGQAMVRAAAGLSALAAGATGAAGAMGLLRGAMAFLGGPWGIAITAIGAALGYLALETGRAKVEAAQLEQSINAQSEALGRAEAAATAHRIATGDLSGKELEAAKRTAALTGEVHLLEEAHYRAAAAAKAHALEEANARVQLAKTNLSRLQQQQQGERVRQVGAVVAGIENLPASERRFLEETARKEQAAGPGGKLLKTAEANLAKALQDEAEQRKRGLAGFQPQSLRSSAPAASGGGGGGGSRAAPRDKTDERLAQIDAALADAESQLVGAMLNLARDVDERARLQKLIIDAEASENDARVRKQIADIEDDKGLKSAEKEELVAQLEIVRAKQQEAASLERQLVDREAADQKASEALDLQQTVLDGQEELLQLQASSARTAKARLEAEIALLDLAEQRAEAETRVIEATNGVASAEAEIARQRLENLRNARPAREGEAGDRNASPLQDYFNSLPRTAEEANEDFERLAANGISDVVDGLAQALAGTRSLGDVFRTVIAQMAVDLTRLNLQRALVGLIGGFAGASAGGTPAAVNGIFGYASGGYTGDGSRNRVAGVVHGQEFVVNADATRRNLSLLRAINAGVTPRAPASSGVSQSFSPTLHINVSGAMSPADARRTGAQVGSAALREMALVRRRGY
jgi:tape measure domain-containing protein